MVCVGNFGGVKRVETPRVASLRGRRILGWTYVQLTIRPTSTIIGR